MKQLNWYQIFGNVHKIPDGRTVTPTDDIQIWLHCADIWDKAYTTLYEVLNDTATLSALMASDNAVDYLVRSTSWAVPISVPVMTSNTTPSGVCIASSEDNPAYYAFNGNTSNGWSSVTVGTSNLGRVGYEFTEAVDIKRVSLLHLNGSNATYTCKVQYSDDGVNWTDIEDSTFTAVKSTQANVSFDAGSHLYWAVYYLSASVSTRALANVLQFYSASVTTSADAMSLIGANDYAAETLLSDATWGKAIVESEYWEDVANVSVPTMTSNTAPSGECICSSNVSSYEAYKAFDRVKTTSDAFASNTYTASDNAYVGYKFTESVSINEVIINTFFVNQSGTEYFAIEGLDSNNQWQTIKDNISISIPATNTIYSSTVNVPNNDNYIGFRLRRTNFVGYNERLWIPTLQFYGRQIGGVQTWLRSAGITDKLYTTLSEVLADSTTLTALMSSHSAVDHLVTAKGWADDICADSGAMTLIGLDNYCANTLLADATWCNAICESEYFESVLNVKVPTMTSDTTPSGTVIESSHYTANYGWQAFDKNTNTRWAAGTQNVGEYCGYIFTSPNAIAAIRYVTASNVSYTAQLKGSNDGETWVNIGETFALGNSDNKLRTVYDGNVYDRYAVFAATSGIQSFIELQFYGREDV